VPAVAVVLPVLDEEARLGQRLAELVGRDWVREIVVVDGGSHDRTVEIAAAVPEVRVLVAARGRGSQMNAGVRATGAEVVLFLHADVQVPADAGRWIATALAAPDVVAGAFRVRTVADAGRNWLGPVLRFSDLRSRWTRFPYGDQAVFVRRAAFEAVGGFPDQPLMEDIELSRRLWTVGRIVTVPAAVRVSARRHLQRPIRTLVTQRLFPTMYRLGVSPETLARLYGRSR
jgi:rSAM/selenodomain-associated transferase 2